MFLKLKESKMNECRHTFSWNVLWGRFGPIGRQHVGLRIDPVVCIGKGDPTKIE